MLLNQYIAEMDSDLSLLATILQACAPKAIPSLWSAPMKGIFVDFVAVDFCSCKVVGVFVLGYSCILQQGVDS